MTKDDLKALIAEEVGPVKDLMKSLEAPARAQGLTPEGLLAKWTDGGRVPGTVTPGGQFVPLAQAPGKKKSLGWGPMLAGMAELASPGVTMERADQLKNKLFAPADQGGFGLTKAALAENSGVTGGYTVAPQFSSNLLQLAGEDSVIEPRASKMPMTGMTLQVPYLDQTSGSTAGRSNFLGGVVAHWTTEAETRTETEPTFRQMELKAWELSFYTMASNNLLADNAVGLDSLLTQLFSMAISWYTDYAYLQGDGVGKPQGVVSAPATIAVTRGTASRFRYVDAVTMLSRLYQGSWKSGVWLAHQSLLPDLLQMHDSSGNQTGFGAGRLVFQSIDQGATQAPATSLLGLPLYFTEKCSNLGTKGDIVLADWSKYLLGQRMDIEIAVSPHVRFLNNQMVWRVVWRGDGQPWLNGPVYLADGTHTVSPFVTLAA